MERPTPKVIDVITVRENATLQEGMRAIDDGGVEIVLVVDTSARLVGTLSDGDVRRAILRGSALDDPVASAMARQFTAVSETAGRAVVLDLMTARSISQVPVLNNEGRIVGLHLLRDIVGSVPRKNWAVVMAGGRGERLRPITDDIPKPMIRVAGRPILERVILHMVGFGIRQVFISVNYKAGIIEKHFGNGSAFGCNIEYLREREPLGTGGALSLLPRIPEEPLLVVNGDVLTQFDAGLMLSFHGRGGYEATIGVHEYSHTIPFGVVDLEEDRVIQLREKPSEVWLANAGIYVLAPMLVARVPRGTNYPLPALVEECLERGEGVGAYRIEEEWSDVGRPEDLRRARGEMDKP